MADWYEVGVADGRAGHPDSRLAQHSEACASASIRPDAEAWRAGRFEGLSIFCTSEFGWRHGSDGGRYQGVCDPAMEPDFLYGYEIGRELYDVNARISSLETRIEGLQRRLVEDDLEDDDRRDIRNQLDSAYRDIRGLERQRGDAEAEARNRGFRDI